MMRRLLSVLILLLVAACSNAGPAAGLPPLHVLAWNPDTKGLAWYTAGSAPQTVSEKVPGVGLCAQDAKTSQSVIFSGDRTGTISLVKPSGEIVALGNGSRMGCELGGRTAFSPDGKWLAHLNYAEDAGLVAEYAVGVLRLIEVSTGKEFAALPGISGFTVQNDSLIAIRLNPGADQQIATADLIVQPPGGSAETIPAALPNNTGCAFVSAQPVRLADTVYVSVGERCAVPLRYLATVYRVDPKTHTAQVLARGTAEAGRYYPGTSTNSLFVLPDGKMLLWMYPDGRTINSASGFLLDTTTGSSTQFMLSMTADQSPAAQSTRLRPGPTGDQLAFVGRNTQNGDTLYLWDWRKADSEPAQINDIIRSDRITAVAWSQDSNRLAYLLTGQDQNLSLVDIRGERRTVRQGTFQGLLLNETGTVAVSAEQTGGSYTLALIRIENGQSIPLIEKASTAPIALFIR